MTFAERLRELRQGRNWTQGQLGKMAGMSTGSVSDLENGRQKKTTQIHELARALGTTVDYLLHGRGPREPTPGSALPRGGRDNETWPEVTVEEARFGAEWGKLDEPLKTQVMVLVEAMVAAKIKRKRRGDAPSARPNSN